MSNSGFTEEQETRLKEFYEDEARRFAERQERRKKICSECEELARQRVEGFKDQRPESRHDTVFDKMCAKISALEAENKDLRDIARRFSSLCAYLATNAPHVLRDAAAAFGHDGKDRNLFMQPYQFVPPFLAEITHRLDEWTFSQDDIPSEDSSACSNDDALSSQSISEELKASYISDSIEEQEVAATKNETSAAADIREIFSLKEDEHDYEREYGWLSPTGKFFPVEWGGHSIWAEKRSIEMGYATEKDFYGTKKSTVAYMPDDVFASLHYADDILMEHGWCLIHNPLHGVPRYHVKVGGPTKKQREYLYDMYVRIGCDDKAATLYREESA